MKSLKKSALFAVAIAFLFGAVAVSNTNAQVLNEILTRMQIHKDKLESLKADVSMTKTDTTLGLSDTTAGTTYYLPSEKRKPYVRVNWTTINGKPFAETLVVKDGEYVLYRKRLGQAIVGNVSDSSKNAKTNSALDFMNMSKRELKSNYKILKLRNEKLGGDEVWHLKLTPKKRKSYQYAELWVNSDGMPVRMKMVERNDDTTVVSLTAVKTNMNNFDAEVFDLELPKGTKIVK